MRVVPPIVVTRTPALSEKAPTRKPTLPEKKAKPTHSGARHDRRLISADGVIGLVSVALAIITVWQLGYAHGVLAVLLAIALRLQHRVSVVDAALRTALDRRAAAELAARAGPSATVAGTSGTHAEPCTTPFRPPPPREWPDRPLLLLCRTRMGQREGERVRLQMPWQFDTGMCSGRIIARVKGWREPTACVGWSKRYFDAYPQQEHAMSVQVQFSKRVRCDDLLNGWHLSRAFTPHPLAAMVLSFLQKLLPQGNFDLLCSQPHCAHRPPYGPRTPPPPPPSSRALPRSCRPSTRRPRR